MTLGLRVYKIFQIHKMFVGKSLFAYEYLSQIDVGY